MIISHLVTHALCAELKLVNTHQCCIGVGMTQGRDGVPLDTPCSSNHVGCVAHQAAPALAVCPCGSPPPPVIFWRSVAPNLQFVQGDGGSGSQAGLVGRLVVRRGTLAVQRTW